MTEIYIEWDILREMFSLEVPNSLKFCDTMEDVENWCRENSLKFDKDLRLITAEWIDEDLSDAVEAIEIEETEYEEK